MKSSKLLAPTLFLLVLAGVWIAKQQIDPQQLRKLAGQGGDFVLQSSQGPLGLKDLRGKVVLIYFGYAACPDICPTNLALMAQALELLTPEQRQQVQGLFISVDPERDDLTRVSVYAQAFDPQILGLRGDAAEIAELAARYGVIYEKVQLGDSAMGYVIDHSSETYVVDQTGQLRFRLPHASAPEQIRDSVLKLLAENQNGA